MPTKEQIIEAAGTSPEARRMAMNDLFVPVSIVRASCVICRKRCPQEHTSFKGYSVCSSKCQQEIIQRRSALAQLGEQDERTNAKAA